MRLAFLMVESWSGMSEFLGSESFGDRLCRLTRLLLLLLRLLTAIFRQRLARQNDGLIAALRRSFLARRFCARRFSVCSLLRRCRPLIAIATTAASATATASTPAARTVVLSIGRLLRSCFGISCCFRRLFAYDFGQLTGIALIEVVGDDERRAVPIFWSSCRCFIVRGLLMLGLL